LQDYDDADVFMTNGLRARISSHRSGTRSGWIKVKTPEWKAANQFRAKLFEKPERLGLKKNRAV